MMKITKRNYWRYLGSLVAATGLLFGGTDATTAPAILVIAGFLLVSLAIYYAIYGIVSAARFYGIEVRRKRSLTLYATGVVSLLLALQSVGELGARDVWVLLPLAGLGYFYNTYARRGQP